MSHLFIASPNIHSTDGNGGRAPTPARDIQGDQVSTFFFFDPVTRDDLPLYVVSGIRKKIAGHSTRRVALNGGRFAAGHVIRLLFIQNAQLVAESLKASHHLLLDQVE